VFWLAASPLLKRIRLPGGLALAVAVSWLINGYGRGLTWYALWETAGPLIHMFLGIALWTCRNRLDFFQALDGSDLRRYAFALYRVRLQGRAAANLLLDSVRVGAPLAYQASLYCARRWYQDLRGSVCCRYFEDNAFSFYLFRIPGGPLIFKALDALTSLSPLPFVLLSFILNLTAVTLIVTLVNTLETLARKALTKAGKTLPITS
jgi:hypothetical protein